MPEIRTVTTLRRKRDEISASIRVDEKKIAQTPRRAGPGCRRCGPLTFHVVADVTTAISHYTRLSAPSYVGRVLGLAAVVVKHMDRLT